MAVLGRGALVRRIHGYADDPDERLTVTPLLDEGQQVGESSIDIRLGSEFIIPRHTNFAAINPAEKEKEEIEKRIGQYQQRVTVGFGESFVLQPGQHVLGSSLEYIRLPTSLTAMVEGRSSWGRLGLFVATASAVAPGFKGVITLELINGGQAALVLFPGTRIAQLVIQEVVGGEAYGGRYDCPTGPQFSRIHRDPDIHFWGDAANFSW